MNQSNVHRLILADEAKGLRHVFIRELEIDAEIGVYPHERGRTQTIIVSVDLAVIEDTRALDDQLENVVCYETVATLIGRLIARLGHINLIETLAENIATECLADPRIQRARVRIEKPTALSAAKSVGIEIERSRPA